MAYIIQEGKASEIGVLSVCADLSYAQAEVVFISERLKKENPHSLIVGDVEPRAEFTVPHFLEAYSKDPAALKRIEDLLLGILKEGESAAVAALINLGVNIIGVRSKVDEIYAQEKVDGARYISVAHQVVFSTVPEATIDAMVVSSSEPIFSYELLSTKYVMALNAQKNGLIPMALNLWKLHVGGASKKVDWNGLYAIGSTVESAIVLREEDLEALWALASRHENEGEKAGE